MAIWTVAIAITIWFDGFQLGEFTNCEEVHFLKYLGH